MRISIVFAFLAPLALAACAAEQQPVEPQPAVKAAPEEPAPAAKAEPESHDHADQGPLFAEGVTREVEDLDNGASISFTVEDAAKVAELQEAARAKFEGEGCSHGCICQKEGVERALENVEKGVKLTLTSADAVLVTEIQAHLAKKAEGGSCGCGKHEDKGGHSWSVLHSDGVTRAAENIDNGVKLVFTASCPKLQATLLEAAQAKVEHMSGAGPAAPHKDSPMHHESVTASAEAAEGGASISFVSSDAAVAPQLQEYAQKWTGAGGHEHHAHGDCPHKKAQEAEGQATTE